MANYDEKQLLVSLKAYSRANPLALDSSSVWESFEEAELYSKSPTAYGGQIISAKTEDGKYHEYILQPSDGGYTLEEVGSSTTSPSDLKQYVVVDTKLPEEGQQQGVIYIETTTNTGSIWDGAKWVKVFEDVESEITSIKSELSEAQASLLEKAPLANPKFTGSVTVDGEDVAVKSYVDGLIANLGGGITVPGVVDSNNPLPEDYKAGQTFRVAEAGTYAGQECEVGDLIMVVADYAEGSASDADFLVIQSNIDGAITSTAETTTVGEIVVFDSVTGKVIKGSSINISSLNDAIAKAHEHSNKTQLDSYDKTQAEILEAAKGEAQGLVDTAKGELQGKIDTKADKATTLQGYGITDAYTITVIDEKLKTITENLNTKVTAEEVDTKINEAKPTILGEAKSEMNARIGDIPEETTVKQYVDNAIGSGGTSSAEAIAQAKQEAIETSKAYTDKALTIVEF